MFHIILQELKTEGRLKITDVDYLSTVACQKADRKDTALYVITVTNEYGKDSAEIEVVVLGMIELIDSSYLSPILTVWTKK